MGRGLCGTCTPTGTAEPLPRPTDSAVSVPSIPISLTLLPGPGSGRCDLRFILFPIYLLFFFSRYFFVCAFFPVPNTRVALLVSLLILLLLHSPVNERPLISISRRSTETTVYDNYIFLVRYEERVCSVWACHASTSTSLIMRKYGISNVGRM